MNILITNTALDGRTGTEIFVAQLAEALRKKCHHVMLYSPLVGELGLELRRKGQLVYERISDIPTVPDVIHAHHVGPTLAALAAFPTCPAIFGIHSVEAEFDRPPIHCQIKTYFTVSTFIREQRATEDLPIEDIVLVPNAVDLESFVLKARIRDLPERGLIVAKHQPGVTLIQDVCRRLAIAVDVVGPGVGQTTADLPSAFEKADLVFASGRSALEALASGCAVILTDGGRFGGMISPDNMDNKLALNLGVAAMTAKLEPLALENAIRDYNQRAAATVTQRVRQTRSLENQAQTFISLYEAAILCPEGHKDRDKQLASLIEAYVPTHGEFRWRALARNVASGRLRSQLEEELRITRCKIVDDERLNYQLAKGTHPFSIGSLACQWLKSGWWEPEDWGVWSKQKSVIEAYVADDVTRITLRYLLFAAELCEEKSGIVSIWLDSQELASYQVEWLSGEQELTFSILSEAKSRRLELRISFPTRRSPKSVSNASDFRELGMGIILLIAA